MADFSNNVQDVVAQTPWAPQPYYDNSVASGIRGISGVLGGLATGIRSEATWARGIAYRNSIEAVQGDYTQQLLKIANGVDQGVLTPQRAKLNARALFYQYVGNHPELTDQLLATHKAVMADAGLGQVIDTGNDAEKLQTLQRQEAAKAGFITPGSDLAEADRGVAAWQQTQLAQANLGLAQKQLEYQRGLIGQQKDYVDLAAAKQNYVTGGINQNIAKLNLFEKNAEVQSQRAITSGVAGLQHAVNTQLQQLDNAVTNKKMTPEQAQMAAQQIVAGAQSTVAQQAPYASSEFVNNALAPIRTLAGAYTDKFSGKIDATTAANQVNASLTHAQSNLFSSSPDFLKITAASKLFPQIIQPFADQLTNEVVGQLGVGTGHTAGVPNVVAGTPSNQSYLNIIQHVAGLNSSGQLTPDQQNEFHQNMHQILSGLHVYGPTADSPTKLNQIINWMASPQIGKYFSNSADASKIDPNDKQQAINLFQHNYETNIQPLLVQEFQKGQVQVGYKYDPNSLTGMGLGADQADMRPTPTQVHPEFNGSGVSFVPNDPSNSGARAAANDLNQKVAPVMNTQIRAMANLQGNRDYKGVYDNMWNGIYQNMGLDPKTGQPVQAAQPAAQSTQNADGSVADTSSNQPVTQTTTPQGAPNAGPTN